MNPLKSNKGITLVEIIIAIAILGIIMVGILGMFNIAVSEVFTSGSRSEQTMDIQKVIDELQTENDWEKLDQSEIIAFLNAKSYYRVTDISQLKTFNAAYEGNYFVTQKTITKDGYNVTGYDVTVLKFFKNGSRTAQLTTFIMGDI